MELDNILFIAVILIAFMLPVIYFIISKKKAASALKKALETQLESFGIRPGEYEILGEKVIGFNDNNSHVFYYQNNNKQKEPLVINLENYGFCRAITSFSKVGNPGAETSLIQKVELELEPKSKGATPVTIPLFDILADFQLQGELQMGEKWREKMNKLLQK